MEQFGWGREEGGWRKGPWTAQEDKLLLEYVRQQGEGRWNSVARLTGTDGSFLLLFRHFPSLVSLNFDYVVWYCALIWSLDSELHACACMLVSTSSTGRWLDRAKFFLFFCRSEEKRKELQASVGELPET